MIDTPDSNRALLLLKWWTPEVAKGAPLQNPSVERIQSMLVSMNALMGEARGKQTEAIASLNSDLLALLRKAVQARDPQILMEIELDAIDRMRRCATACSQSWLDIALKYNSLL